MGGCRRVSRMLATVVCAVVLVSATPASGTTSTVVLDESQIADALLRLEDLPADEGFLELSGEAPPADLGSPSETGGVCDGPNLAALVQDAGGRSYGWVSYFNGNSDGPYVSESVLSFPNANAARRFVKANRAQATSCRAGWSSPSSVPGDPPYQYEITASKGPKVGDERFVSHTVSTGGGDDITREPDLPGVTETAVVRVGNNVVMLTRQGIGVVMDDAPQALRADLKVALTRLADVVRGARAGD